MGQITVSLNGTNYSPKEGPNTLGLDGCVNQGTWSSATTYHVFDCVTKSGVNYFALKPSLNVDPPTDSTTWKVTAQPLAAGDGTLTNLLSDTASRRTASNPFYTGMGATANYHVNDLGSVCNTGYSPAYSCPGYNNENGIGGGSFTSVLNTAMRWAADARAVAPGGNLDPNGYLAATIYALTHVDDMLPANSPYCDETVNYCHNMNGDYAVFDLGLDIQHAAATFSIVRNWMSSTEKTAFLDRMLNDNSSANGGTDSVQCTKPTAHSDSNGSATIASVSGKTVTGSGTHFLSDGVLQVGWSLFVRTGSIDYSLGVIKSITSDTSIQLTARAQNSGGTVAGLAYYATPSWGAGAHDCGVNWYKKHHTTSPPSPYNFAQTLAQNHTAYQSNYGPLGGSQWIPGTNIGSIMEEADITLGLAAALDDSRARTLLQSTWAVFWNFEMPFNWGQMSPFVPSLTGYSNATWGNSINVIPLEMAKSFSGGGPDITGTYEGERLQYWIYFLDPGNTNAIFPWGGEGGLMSGGPYWWRNAMQKITSNFSNPLIPYYYAMFRAQPNWPTMYTTSSGSQWLGYPYGYLGYDASVASGTLTDLPTQYKFDTTAADLAKCNAAGLTGCSTTWSETFVSSKQSWTLSASGVTSLTYFANPLNSAADHTSGYTTGNIHLFRGTPYGSNVYTTLKSIALLGGDELGYGWNEGALTSNANTHENHITVGSDSTITFNPSLLSTASCLFNGDTFAASCLAVPITRWAGGLTTKTGRADSAYMYLMQDLTNGVNTSVSPTRVNRHVVHFKNPNTGPNVVVVYDDIATSAGQQKKVYWQFPTSNYSTTHDTDCAANMTYDTANLVYGYNNGHSKILIKTIPLNGAGTVILGRENTNFSYTAGAGYTCRMWTGAASSGVLSSANMLSEQVHVIYTTDTVGDAAPTVTSLSAGSSWAVEQIVTADASNPKVVAFARQGAAQTSLTYTTTYSGTAQHVIAGLTAGTYSVTNGGSAVSGSPFSVLSGDNSLGFSSTSGAVVITQTGTPTDYPLSPSLAVTSSASVGIVQRSPNTHMKYHGRR